LIRNPLFYPVLSGTLVAFPRQGVVANTKHEKEMSTSGVMLPTRSPETPASVSDVVGPENTQIPPIMIGSPLYPPVWFDDLSLLGEALAESEANVERSVEVATQTSPQPTVSTADAMVQVTAPDEVFQFPGFRFRRRSRIVKELERVFFSASDTFSSVFSSGGRTSSGGCEGWFRAIFGREAKVVSCNRVEPSSEGDQVDFLLSIRLSGTDELMVSLFLLSRLLAYAYFRPRTEDLVQLLRSRAQQWASQMGMSPFVVACVLPGCVAAAMRVPLVERTAVEAMSRGWGSKTLALVGASGLLGVGTLAYGLGTLTGDPSVGAGVCGPTLLGLGHLSSLAAMAWASRRREGDDH